MTVDQIVHKIYEERYSPPADPATAAYMREVMIREIVERALGLAIGGLAQELVETRNALNAAHLAVTHIYREESTTFRAIGDYDRASAAWNAVLAKLDGWIASGNCR